MKTYEELLAERDAAMREASELAMCIWRSEFRNESPEFELCDSPAGVISQIDNMFAGIRQQRDALAAKVERLTPLARRCIWGALVWNDHNFGDLRGCLKEEIHNAGILDIDDANEFLAETPQQCLAEIKAEAVLCFATYIDSTGELSGDDCTFIIDEANQYAAKIRNTGTWLKDSNVNGGKRQGGEK